MTDNLKRNIEFPKKGVLVIEKKFKKKHVNALLQNKEMF